MDPNGRNESVPDGLIEAVAAANHETYSKNGTPDKSASDPAANANITGAQNTHKPKTNKQTQTEETEEYEGDDEGLDTQDFSRKPVPSRTEVEDTETGEPSKTETNTEAEKPSDYDWLAELPQAPEEKEILPPKPDEFGQIDPVEYADYLEARLDQKRKIDDHNRTVITKAFDAVEKILPEVKDTPSLQKVIRNTFLANSNPVEIVDLARELRTTLDGKTQAGKTQGIQNAKSSITIQKNAAVETKSPTQKTQTSSKNDTLAKRLAKNDTSAFEELMSDWQQNNKV